MRRSPTETIRFLTLDETIRLFRAIGTHRRDRALFLVAYRHGLRASEVGLLRVEDLDFKALRIMVHRLKGSHSGAHPRCNPTKRKRSRLFSAPVRSRRRSCSRATGVIRLPAAPSIG
jgi:integrase